MLARKLASLARGSIRVGRYSWKGDIRDIRCMEVAISPLDGGVRGLNPWAGR